MYAFVEAHRDAHGVEPICRVLQIAPSAYRRYAARQRDRSQLSARAKRDDALMPKVETVWTANLQVYGADKVWKQMNREGEAVARCTVERLMRRLGLQGVRRGKVVRTTISDEFGVVRNSVCEAERLVHGGGRRLATNDRRGGQVAGGHVTALAS